MLRTQNSFSLLQATAAVCTFAIILWSLGVPAIRFAEAANVTSFNDTLSDSAPATVSNHTISFVTPTGLAQGETISVEFETGFTGIGSLLANDLDLSVNGSDQSLIDGAASGADWNVTAAVKRLISPVEPPLLVSTLQLLSKLVQMLVLQLLVTVESQTQPQDPTG